MILITQSTFNNVSLWPFFDKVKSLFFLDVLFSLPVKFSIHNVDTFIIYRVAIYTTISSFIKI